MVEALIWIICAAGAFALALFVMALAFTVWDALFGHRAPGKLRFDPSRGPGNQFRWDYDSDDD